ncbi:MAG: diguanylate cyclase [Alphaproteobacteria bacterium]|nr:diguanylate cyclase [Alphaproteobacteria bacterium]
MSKFSSDFIPAEAASLADENALLRASLAEARQRIAALEQGSDNDPLTGLPTRGRVIEELERVVGQAERHGTPAALLTIDIKRLGGINAAHGEIGGDAVLVHVTRSLSALIRTTDLLARTGGGEFALILDHLDLDSAIETGERISRCIASSPVDLGGRSFAIAASVGVTGIISGDSVADVLARAEKAIAFAKSEG